MSCMSSTCQSNGNFCRGGAHYGMASRYTVAVHLELHRDAQSVAQLLGSIVVSAIGFLKSS